MSYHCHSSKHHVFTWINKQWFLSTGKNQSEVVEVFERNDTKDMCNIIIT